MTHNQKKLRKHIEISNDSKNQKRIIKIGGPKKAAVELNNGHTLRSITDTVLMRYSDRPDKLK
jgi:hypothetical protein